MQSGPDACVDYFGKIRVSSLTEMVPPLCYSETDLNIIHIEEEVFDPHIDLHQ